MGPMIKGATKTEPTAPKSASSCYNVNEANGKPVPGCFSEAGPSAKAECFESTKGPVNARE